MPLAVVVKPPVLLLLLMSPRCVFEPLELEPDSALDVGRDAPDCGRCGLPLSTP